MLEPPAPDAAAPGRPDAEPGELVGDRYLLTTLIASGGMAEVWEATDQVLGRPVAVKVLHRHLASSDTFSQRFRAEALAAARLHHPSIVSIYDTCSDDGRQAIVMELVRGRTLRAYLDQRGRIEPDEVIQIGADVSSALTAAHNARIVHRDIKPANILLCDDARVMVTDFGIAKVRDDTDLTNTGTMLGTVKYLAPEQVESAPVDARTDVYALGVVLYEALVGRPPFLADTAAATALARLHQTPPSPRQVHADVPAALDAAVMRSLARNPSDRFASAAEFRTALLAPDAARTSPLTDPTTVDTAVSPSVPVTNEGATSDPAQWPAPPPRPPVMAFPLASPTAPPPTGRHWILPLVLVLVIGGSIGLAIALLLRTQSTDTAGSAGGSNDPATISGARSFDPYGGDGEHDEEVGRAIDGDTKTSWKTETYAERDFGGDKTGVGLVVDLDRSSELQSFRVDSPTTGWSAQVYVAEGPGSTLDEWGEPVASAEDIDGGAVFDLGTAEGRSVLLWITQVGDNPRRMQVDELTLSSR